MFDNMRMMLSRVDADYADIRYEIKKETIIQYEGKELTRIGSNSTDGYVLRVLKDGGLASASFTKADDAERAVRTAVENAGLIARRIDKPVRLAEVETIKETFQPPMNEDPRNVSMMEKLELIRHYNEIPLQHEKIVTTKMGYTELLRERYFLSSTGSEIREDLITTRLGGLIISKDGNLTQNISVASGGSDGFANVRNQEADFEQRTAVALDLLNAKPVEGGVYNVILNPEMTGLLTHEAFGHFSEADIIETLPAMREKMHIGSKLGNDALTIIDDATQPHQLGFYKYDDEGVPVRPVTLMQDGVLTGRLHSRRTAAEFDEPVSGHCVAEDFRYEPMVRMGNIYIAPGSFNFDDLTAQLGDGLYVVDPKGGQTAGENFTFGAQYGYVVKNGKVGEMIRDINLSGNLYQTLQNIVAIGNDLRLVKSGGCGKGQMNMRSGGGGPHILAKNLVIGGV